jgi:tetratricopeptide (TPR) repeat protein
LLALVLLDEGKIDEAKQHAEEEADPFWRTWSLAIIYSAAGDTAKADETLRKLVDENAKGNAYQIAEVYSKRGEIDEAFKWLELAIAERDPGVTHAKVNPRFKALHGDPRWREFLSKMGM